MNKTRLSILLVDDDDVTAESIERCLRRQDIDVPVIWAEDGRVGLEILRGQHREKRIEAPFVIVLDLNMPRMNGLEFLKELRSDEKLRTSVVFVLSTSDSDRDRSRAYNEQIAGYMVKSAVGPQCVKVAQLLADYAAIVAFP